MAENDILGVPQWWIWVAVGVVVFIAIIVTIIISLTVNKSARRKRKELEDSLKKIEIAQEMEKAERARVSPRVVQTTPIPQVRQRSETVFENI